MAPERPELAMSSPSALRLTRDRICSARSLGGGWVACGRAYDGTVVDLVASGGSRTTLEGVTMDEEEDMCASRECEVETQLLMSSGGLQEAMLKNKGLSICQ